MTRHPVELEDRLAITELLARYCHAMDASRADLVIDLFAEDAILETPVGNAEGREAILDWIENRLSLRSVDYQVGHYLLNPLLAPISQTRIQVRSMLLYTRQAVDADLSAELLSTGIYEDEVVKTSTCWRFARRRWGLREPLLDAYFSPAAD